MCAGLSLQLAPLQLQLEAWLWETVALGEGSFLICHLPQSFGFLWGSLRPGPEHSFPLISVCLAVWQHGPGGTAGARGGQEVPHRGAVPRL